MINVHRTNRQEKPTFAQKLNLGVGRGLDIASQLMEKHENKEKLREENEAVKKFGKDITGIHDPKMRQEAVKYAFEAESKKNKFSDEILQEKKRRDSIEKHFGADAAEIYETAPEGGKTEIIKHLLENSQRGRKFSESLGKQKEESPSEIKTIDFDKGLTPKERIMRQEHRYDKNLPLYQESQHKTQALEHAKDSLEILEELSPHIGGWDRLNINPSTGSLIIPSAASPEAQRFVKTVNDFTVNAKDSFGARVTNFELDRFMQRLPTLANSIDGREQIIKQMKILNDMNLQKEKSIQNIIDQHGGIRNIDYDQAERLAEKENKQSFNELRKEFKKIDSNLDKQYSKKIEDDKKIVPKDHVPVKKADGSTGYIPKKSLKDFLKVPGNKAL